MTNNNIPNDFWTANDIVRGCVLKENQFENYLLHGTPHDIAHFIVKHPLCEKIIITDLLDRFILSTIGCFLDYVPNRQLRDDVVKELIPLQQGKDTDDIPCYEEQTVEDIHIECSQDYLTKMQALMVNV